MERKEYIMKQLAQIGDVTCRPMMGEYLLYLDGVLIGGIYDNTFLLKVSPGNQGKNLPERIPYASAKRTMYVIDDLDDSNFLHDVMFAAYGDLKSTKKR